MDTDLPRHVGPIVYVECRRLTTWQHSGVTSGSKDGRCRVRRAAQSSNPHHSSQAEFDEHEREEL